VRSDVRFGSKADIRARPLYPQKIRQRNCDVRFVPKADIGRPAFKPRAAGVAFNQANQGTGAQMRLLWIPLTIALAFLSFSAVAADYPAPKEADWTARDFKFHTGEVCCPSCVCTTPR